MAQDSEWYQRPSPAIDPKIPKRGDSECFSPLADQFAGDTRALCAKCGKKAIGAEFVSFEEPASSLRMYAVVRFSCGCDGRKSFAISAKTLFPQWDLISMLEPGVWKISKVSVQKRIKVCSQE